MRASEDRKEEGDPEEPEAADLDPRKPAGMWPSGKELCVA